LAHNDTLNHAACCVEVSYYFFNGPDLIYQFGWTKIRCKNHWSRNLSLILGPEYYYYFGLLWI